MVTVENFFLSACEIGNAEARHGVASIATLQKCFLRAVPRLNGARGKKQV